MKSLTKQKKGGGFLRPFVQISMIVLIFAVTVSRYLAGRGIFSSLLSKVSIHTVCPFGGVVTLYQLFTTGGYIGKIHASAVFLLVSAVICALFFGALFCGYFCPFGSVQEFIGKIGKKIFGKKYNRFIPQKIDAGLRYLRYAAAVLVIVKTAVSAKLVFADIDPYNALFNFFTGEVAPAAFAALAAVAVMSLFVERPWCKYFCPYGAVLGLSNAVSLFKIRRNPPSCSRCGACDSVCPMNIGVSHKTAVLNHQCIRCYKCLSGSGCPVPNTVLIAPAFGAEKKTDSAANSKETV